MDGYITWAFVGIMILVYAWLIWGGICNNRALVQGKRIVDAIKEYCMGLIAMGNFDTNDIWGDFEKVPYEKHVWYLMTFRDPIKLYSQRIYSQRIRGALAMYNERSKKDVR